MPGPATTGGRLSISANEWNKLRSDARRAIQEAGRTGPAQSLPRSSDLVAVKHLSGAALPMYGIVGFWGNGSSGSIGPVYGPDDNLPEFKRRPVFKIRKVDDDESGGEGGHSDVGRFAILQQPLKPGYLGVAQVSGVALCKLDVVYETHVYADVKDGNADELKTGEVGAAEILWKQSGTGSGKWALVRLGNFVAPPLVGRLTTDSDAGSPLTVEIVDVYNNVTGRDTGREVSAYISFGIIQAPYTSNVVPANTLVHLRYDRVFNQFLAVAPLSAWYPRTAFDPTA